jgi:PAS domain S-box-containing protein
MSDKGVEILIVEDSPTQAEQLKYLLEERGHSVNIATNGKQALDKLLEYRPALVISDIVMPEMDGYTLCREIKSDKNLRGIPVILVTALSDPDDIIKGLESGADNFIMKPYAEKYLLKIIQQILINQEFQQEKPMQMGMEIFFRDKKYFITADRLQILTLLLSTYETAVEKNLDLLEAQNELKKLNEELEEKVKDRTADLVEEVAERKKAEEKISHLNVVLRAIRNVNQLITRELDRDQLLQEACKSLVEKRGYRTAWIALLDESGKLISSAETGAGEQFSLMVKQLKRGDLPECCLKARKESGVLVIDEKRAECIQCPLSDAYPGSSSMTMRLEYGGKTYGFITVSSLLKITINEEEISLFQEVSGDIAFALYNLNVKAEKKKAEEALKQSEKKYRVLIENLPQKIFLKDKNSAYISCNENYARDLKIRPEEITGKTDYDFYPKELAEKYRADDQRIIEVGNIEDVDEKYFQNAHEVWVHTVKTPVKDEKGNIVGILGIFWDISEHKKMEDELKNRVKELEDFYNMSVGRELRMIELKKEIERLKEELEKYKKDS